MVWEADPDQVQLTADSLGVAVDEFGGQALDRPEKSLQ
jgi:hypothetical protein